MHTQMKHTLANIQDLIPTLAGILIHKQHKPAKVGIKSCRFARECVSSVHAWMHLELCLYDQLDS